MNERDEQGRFRPGNTLSRAGGCAAAQRLTPAQRSQRARAGLAGLARKHFDGDMTAAGQWLASAGLWVQDAPFRAMGLGAFAAPQMLPGVRLDLVPERAFEELAPCTVSGACTAGR